MAGVRDPFPTGDVRGGEQQDMKWWNPRDQGFRLVGKVGGVYKGRKRTFVVFKDAVIFRTADWKPLERHEAISMDVRDAPCESTDAGAWAIVTTNGSTPGKKDGVSFMKYDTRIFSESSEADRVASLHKRARKRLAEEAAMAPLPEGDDDDLPF